MRSNLQIHAALNIAINPADCLTTLKSSPILLSPYTSTSLSTSLYINPQIKIRCVIAYNGGKRMQLLHGEEQPEWLGLMIGNSRWHFALFRGENLEKVWDTEHPSEDGKITDLLKDHHICEQIPIYMASVVPAQTTIWKDYQNIQLITLKDVPLLGVYPTLGIDRALAVLGAGKSFGFPVLVIDAGTALTFTAADEKGQLVGGAILPGLGLQLNSLAQKTAELPLVNTGLITSLPPRFALNTTQAIESGIIYTILAGITDFIHHWQRQFPGSKMAITGGDRTTILNCLKLQFPDIARSLINDGNLIFLGMRSL